MKIASGFKEFDKQANKAGIMTGNVISDVQLSGYVRAHNCPARPSGEPCSAGEMQKWDLEQGMLQTLPAWVKDRIRLYAENEQVIAYEFFYFRRKRKHVIGYSVTRPGDPATMLWSWCQAYPKAMHVMMEVNKAITNPPQSPTQHKAKPLEIPVFQPPVFVW